MQDLEAQLSAASGARLRLVATDGVFSMDGDIAPLADIAALCRQARPRCGWQTWKVPQWPLPDCE